MGAWNAKPFGNDGAGDWLLALEEAKDDSVIKAAFEAGADEEESVAAATVVEAARRQPVGSLPQTAKQWILEQGFVPSDVLVQQALAAMVRIKTQSELRELWAESNSLKAWLTHMDSLCAGLQEVATAPPPLRRPKESTPRLLGKMIAKIKPDEESPLREKLRKKLEAITDLEAPVPGTLPPEAPLKLLAEQGLLPEAKRLIERGAKINPALSDPNDSTPLEAACRFGHAEMVEWLLVKGATIYVNRAWPSGTGDKKIVAPTALCAAIRSGSIATIETLVQHGARLNTEDYEKELEENGFWHDTLLHKAVDANQPFVVEFLLKNGMSPDVRDSLQSTPLITAANQAGQKDIKKVVEMLLSLGANPNAKDNHGRRGLIKLVSQRRKLLTYLKKKDASRYSALISSLELRK